MTQIQDLMAFGPMLYWGIAVGAAAGVYRLFLWTGSHLSPVAKDALARWLAGEYDRTWPHHFCNAFDTVFTDKHLSWRCFRRSAAASIAAVLLMYAVFYFALGVDAKRAPTQFTLGQILLIGMVINILPDYLSLYQTRWLLRRFEQARSVAAQLGVLIIDAVATGAIIGIPVILFQLTPWGEEGFALINAVAVFSVYSLFFYSTFITSVWAWLYCASLWFMRLFSRTPLKRILNVRAEPVRQIAFVSAVLVFLGTLAVNPLIDTQDGEISQLDELLCDLFPADICEKLIPLTDDEAQALRYIYKACDGGKPALCVKEALNYFEGDRDQAAKLFERACLNGDAVGCRNLTLIYL